MADVFLDPRRPDYFAQLEAGQSGLDVFLGEGVGVVKGVDLSTLDRDFLSRVTLPQTWEMKKMSVAKALDGSVSLNMLDADRFREQLRALQRLVPVLISSLLPVS